MKKINVNIIFFSPQVKNQRSIIKDSEAYNDSKKTNDANNALKDNVIHKGLPELPVNVMSENTDLTLQDQKNLLSETENENSSELLPRASSDDMIKHIPTDIADTVPDETSGQNIAEISSSSIKPILQIESVF